MDDFPDNQEAFVWSPSPPRFEQLGDITQARRALNKPSRCRPNSLPTRNALFDFALKQRDDPGMRDAQEKVLEIVKSKSDPGYVLTEVKRRRFPASANSSDVKGGTRRRSSNARGRHQAATPVGGVAESPRDNSRWCSITTSTRR